AQQRITVTKGAAIGDLEGARAGDVGRVLRTGGGATADVPPRRLGQRGLLRRGRERGAGAARPGEHLARAVGRVALRGLPGGVGHAVAVGVHGRDASRAYLVGGELAGPLAGNVAGLVDARVGLERGAVRGHVRGRAQALRHRGERVDEALHELGGVGRGDEVAVAVDRRVPQVVDAVQVL